MNILKWKCIATQNDDKRQLTGDRVVDSAIGSRKRNMATLRYLYTVRLLSDFQHRYDSKTFLSNNNTLRLISVIMN